jgi:hypothetical protein
MKQQEQQESCVGALHSDRIAQGDSKGQDSCSNGKQSQGNEQPGSDDGRENALFWKDKGNMAFKAGKWEVAVQAYLR